MKNLSLLILASAFTTLSLSQKPVAPPEGEYSDPTGLSGTYYPTTTLPYGDTKKVCSLVKIDYNAEKNSVTMYAIKGETDPSVLYMMDYHKYARDNFGVSQFKAGDFNIFTVEPGVIILGAYKWAPKDYPGYVKGMMIADTSKMKPVILVKDEAMKSKYTHADAVRIIGEKGTLSEIHNTLRFAENIQVPSIGAMTQDRDLVKRSIELMKVKWAESPEPTNFVACYIHSEDWGTVQYGSVQGIHKVTFSDEVLAIMLFKDPNNGLCYYYAIGISRESEDINANGIKTERGLHMTGNSTIQYITEARMNETIALLPQ